MEDARFTDDMAASLAPANLLLAILTRIKYPSEHPFDKNYPSAESPD